MQVIAGLVVVLAVLLWSVGFDLSDDETPVSFDAWED